MGAAAQHNIGMIGLPHSKRANPVSVSAASAGHTSRLTIANVLKYRLLPGGVVVVLALSAPGFSLGAGDLTSLPASDLPMDMLPEKATRSFPSVSIPVAAVTPAEPMRHANPLAMPVRFPDQSPEVALSPGLAQGALTSAVSSPEAPIEIPLTNILVEPSMVDRILAPATPVTIGDQLPRIDALAAADAALSLAISEVGQAVGLAETAGSNVLDDLTVDPLSAREPVTIAALVPGPSYEAAPQAVLPLPELAGKGFASADVSARDTLDLLPQSEVAPGQSAVSFIAEPIEALGPPTLPAPQPLELAAMPIPQVQPGLLKLSESAEVLKPPDPHETAPLASVVDPVRPATLPPSVSANPFELDIRSQLVTRIDGKVAGQLDFQQTNQSLSVRLGSIVELLQDRYDMSEFERITASSASEVFVSMKQLRNAGIPITYDPVYDEFNVGSRDHRPAAAHKVQIDQISTPEYGQGRAVMEQVRP